MKRILLWFGRLACFFALFSLLVLFADTYLHQMDAVTSMTLEQMKARDDIELCFVGSSTARNHLNPALITQLTGKRTFDAAIMGASLQASIAIAEELLRTNHPQWIVLVVDGFNFETAKEDSLTEPILMPHLTSLRTKLRYYVNLCREDGAWIDRLFLFREYGILAPAEISKNFGLIYDTEATFERIKGGLGPGITYMGDGYLRNTSGDKPDEQIRQLMIARDEPYDYQLLDPSLRMLREIMSLCEDAGIELLVLITPNHTAQMLSERDLLPYTDSLIAFCHENNLPLFNLAYAKPELLPCLDSYYYDLYHFDGEGSDIFSSAFARLFNLYLDGGDVEALAYRSGQEYRDSVDFITNVWFTHDAETHAFTADCNRGTFVEPEYRYALVDENGAWTTLRDYDTDPTFVFDVPDGCALRVFARPRGDASATPVWYDYPTDYEVYFGA